MPRKSEIVLDALKDALAQLAGPVVVRNQDTAEEAFTGDDGQVVAAGVLNLLDGTARVVGTMGLEIREDIVTVDDDLRRFQYSIVDSPLNLANHLSTVDILEDGDGCVVVYSTDVSPDEAGMILDAVAKGGVDALVERFG